MPEILTHLCLAAFSSWLQPVHKATSVWIQFKLRHTVFIKSASWDLNLTTQIHNSPPQGKEQAPCSNVQSTEAFNKTPRLQRAAEKAGVLWLELNWAI